jgi:signal transduction histidine kinase
MRNPFQLSAKDEPYKAKLQEALIEDVYRRAPMPLLMFVPIVYMFYLVLADAIPQRPIIGWVLVGMFLTLGPRLASIVFVDRIKARYPDPLLRIAIFAIGAALLGGSMAALNVLAAPVVSPQQLMVLAFIAAGVNSIAVVSMSASLVSYLLYMVPSIASIAVAILIGPELEFRGVLLFLSMLSLFSLLLMASYVHLKTRGSILLGLQVDETITALRHLNRQLGLEIEERFAAEDALAERNTELESVNQKLAGAQSQLLQSERLAAVGQLAAGVAHEINNPIAFVRSNLSSLGTYVKNILALLDAYEQIESAPDSQAIARRTLEQLKRSINLSFLREDIPSLLTESTDGLTRVENIVRDLKGFSHLDQAQWQSIDIHLGLESTLNVAAHEINSKADIVREYADLPAIQCLPAQINQVFLNLLINATQALDGRGTITVRTGRDENSIWVEIADTGKGIEPAYLSRIFDPFFTTKPVGTGPGLGLSVSYSIIHNHGGTIEAASEIGKGSTFTVRLPINASTT